MVEVGGRSELAKEFARAFYDSVKWRACRRAYIDYRVSIDGGMCEVCHNALGYIVHHKIWLTPENIHNASVALNFNNLRYECHECHNKEKLTGENRQGHSPCARYVFSEDGTLLPLPPLPTKNFCPK